MQEQKATHQKEHRHQWNYYQYVITFDFVSNLSNTWQNDLSCDWKLLELKRGNESIQPESQLTTRSLV